MSEPAPIPFLAVLLLAGSGSRLGAAVPKAFVELAGAPLWEHAAATLRATPGCAGLVLVVPSGLEDAVRGSDVAAGAVVVEGGARRQDSVRAALAVLPEGAGIVAVHDSARPLVTEETVLAAVAEAARTGAALAAEPAWDTLKQVDEHGVVVATPDRSALWHAQTPQCFDRNLLLRAHEACERDGVDATDDAMLVERLGEPVHVVQSVGRNFKVTRPDDLVMAEAIVRTRRETANSGQGDAL